MYVWEGLERKLRSLEIGSATILNKFRHEGPSRVSRWRGDTNKMPLLTPPTQVSISVLIASKLWTFVSPSVGSERAPTASLKAV